MWPYLVAYELAKGKPREDCLAARLQEMQGQRLMSGLWLVVVDEGARHILQFLSPCLSVADRVVIFELAEDAASWNMEPKLN